MVKIHARRASGQHYCHWPPTRRWLPARRLPQAQPSSPPLPPRPGRAERRDNGRLWGIAPPRTAVQLGSQLSRCSSTACPHLLKRTRACCCWSLRRHPAPGMPPLMTGNRGVRAELAQEVGRSWAFAQALGAQAALSARWRRPEPGLSTSCCFGARCNCYASTSANKLVQRIITLNNLISNIPVHSFPTAVNPCIFYSR